MTQQTNRELPQPVNAVSWFEIPVTDLERARAFYEFVLGIELSVHELGPLRMAWFPMHPGASGASGSLVQAAPYEPSHKGSLVYLSVTDIEAALERVQAKGGQVINPKRSIGQHGFVAHFEDCEGNRVALHSTT
jgi:predicted enzyme related to lactoylglutathione lyase